MKKFKVVSIASFILQLKLFYFINKLPPLVLNLDLHTSMLTYNLKKELNSGEGTFIFNGFRLRPFTNLVYTDDEMLKTIKFLKAKNIDNNQL